MSQKKDISILIVNYKSWIPLNECLQSLQFDEDLFSFEVIIVDNCSNDGEISNFKKRFQSHTFIENSGNNGFANGCNLGVKNSSADYLLFLNPDTIANKQSIFKMWQLSKQNPTIGIVSCLQKKLDGSYEKRKRNFLKLSTLFGFFRFVSTIFSSKLYSNAATENSVLFTDWISGSVVFMSKNWFNQISGWNEDYWMYYEDMDLSKRVSDAKGKVALLQDCEIIHNHGGASRININTSKITKTQVQISKHVYIENQLVGFERFISHILLIAANLLFKFLLAFISIFFFFIPKARLNVYLFIEIVKYYLESIITKTWLSKKSMNHKIND